MIYVVVKDDPLLWRACYIAGVRKTKRGAMALAKRLMTGRLKWWPSDSVKDSWRTREGGFVRIHRFDI